MLNVHTIPAFTDNYIWLIQAKNTAEVLIVDPGDADPVLTTLSKRRLIPAAILITHHHYDHVDGIAEIIRHYPIPVYGPAAEHIPGVTKSLTAAQAVNLHPSFPDFTVLATPGHTSGHISYLCDDQLFCGDTLFAGGCGRLLGGTAEQLYQSLQDLKQLTPDTLIYCAHEYTAANLRFAATIEPGNLSLQQRIQTTVTLRHELKPTVPSRLATELETNPFLRCEQATVKQAVEVHFSQAFNTPQAVFTAMRKWKDNF